MKALATTLALALLPGVAAAQMTSDYTRYDAETDCVVINQAPDDAGHWSDLACTGYANYPFLIRYGDGRETITYGFETEAGMPGIGPFNYAHGVVEWRLKTRNGVLYPVAAIQRWYLANTEGEWANQMLVVSRVGQPNDGGGCAIGFLSATDGVNERARQLADEKAENFNCGSDRITVDEPLRSSIGVDNPL